MNYVTSNNIFQKLNEIFPIIDSSESTPHPPFSRVIVKYYVNFKHNESITVRRKKKLNRNNLR